MALVTSMYFGGGYGYILGPSPVPPIYLAGSFGLVPSRVDKIHALGRASKCSTEGRRSVYLLVREKAVEKLSGKILLA